MSASGLGRKFHFIREIASGGFGSVYLAKVIHGDGFARICAVKLLHPKWSENEEIASRMRDEARLLGWLRHKNLVEVLDLTRIGGRVAVIMEYLEAVDVKAIIGDGLHRAEAIPVRACLEICASVASALDAAYNRPPYAGEKPLRVIHRDIKPSNIMVDTSGSVKVLDFGVARADFAERESKTQELSFGSIEYMPPERLFFEPDTPQGDVYSLGVTLYELLSLEKFGKAKLRSEQMAEFVENRWIELRNRRAFPGPEVEGEVHLLIKDMLAFDNESRPTAADCVNRIRIIARRCNEESLPEWAEAVVPPIFATQLQQTGGLSADSLVDQTLAEDGRGFHRDDESTDVSTAPAPPEFLKPDPDDEEDSLDESGRLSDEQWKKLKEATLNDITKDTPKEVAPPPPVAAPAKPAPPKSKPAAPVANIPEPPTLENDSTTAPGAKDRAATPPKVVDGGAPKVGAKTAAPPPKVAEPSPPAAEPPRKLAEPAPTVVEKRPGSDVPPPMKTMIRSVTLNTDEEDAEDPPTVSVMNPFARQAATTPAAPPPVVAPAPPVASASPLVPPKIPPAPTAVMSPADLATDEVAKPPKKPKKEREKPKKVAKPEPEPEVEEEGGGGWGLIIGVIVFLSVLVIGGIAVGVLGLGVGGVAIFATQQGTTPVVVDPPPDTKVPPPETKTPPPETKAPVVIEGPAATFTSAAPGTKKLTVKCKVGEGSGVAEVKVGVTNAGECTVTAVDDKRKRFTAIVKKVEAKTYTCFADGGKECTAPK